MKRLLPIAVVLLGLSVAMLHRLALTHKLYFHYAWFDIMMHFLGGLLIALFACFLAGRWLQTHLPYESRTRLYVDVLLFSVIVGLLWESFELIFELTILDATIYIQDTLLDFVMNTLGVLSGLMLVSNTVFRKTL
jgi:hypothetical protein